MDAELIDHRALIIDVDAHAEPAHDWLDAYPKIREALPPMLPIGDPQFETGVASSRMFAWFIASDLLRHRPVGNRLSAKELNTPFIDLIYDTNRPAGLGYDGADQHVTLDAPKRVKWLDDNGIAVQNLISGTAYGMARFVENPALSMDVIEAANSWMIDHVGDHINRLKPVTTLRFDDMDRAIAELTRMRTAGSRSFLVSGEPVGDIPPYHEDFDRLWAAAVDLGMMPMLHVGMGPAQFHAGWGNTKDPGIAKRIATGISYQAAVTMLNGLVFGGVFDRHPNLTFLISEFGIEWLPFTIRNMDGRGAPASPFLGDYTLSLSPAEYLQRNVRVSPLPAPHQSPKAILQEFSSMAVFSSDYPHYEANGPTPVAYYDEHFQGFDPTLKASFMGNNINECFARMGDPLVGC